MIIKYLAHASFLITSEKGTKIVTDPYTPNSEVKYDPINESADILTMSHGHGDHSNARAIKGNPQIIKEAGKKEIKDISIRAIPSFHDEVKGGKRGNIIITCFNVDGLNLCHAGDLGYILTEKEAKEIGAVDILMIPVGGYYTIDANQATQVVNIIKPKVVIPMHYKTPKLNYPVTTEEDFLIGKKNVKKLNINQVEFRKGSLPEELEIDVLQPTY